MTYMVQYTDQAATENEALEMASDLASQIDFVAGRVMAPSKGSASWRLQVLFEDCGHDLPLPDGCRRVIIPAGFLNTMTISRR